MSDEAITRLNAALQDRYRVDRELGRGGMATVYLAEDLKHKRRVALKVLRPELSAILGAERFLGEIEVTAKLQHPHILPLFDSGQADGLLFYVMPYVEGESLRTWLDRQKQLSVADAVRVTKAIAGALAYAHKRGVIHRDIKPENVLLHEGEPLVADFGIALAVSTAGVSRLTETGLSLGTPFYMSPEQASADRELGPASDIYSLGCMLYEMLVGEPPHTGRTAQAVLTKILTERPRPVSELRSTVPANVAAVVSKAIERLPADRFASAEEITRALDDPAFRHEGAASGVAAAERGRALASGGSLAGRLVPWAVAAAAITVALWTTLAPAREPAPVPLRLPFTGIEVMASVGGVRLAISPDGSRIVVGSAEGGVFRLYQRSADDPQFRAIPDTENAVNFTFSPDGQWLVFDVTQEIRKVSLSGGPSLPVALGTRPHWGDDGTIVFTHEGDLYRVSEHGGPPELILAADSTEAPNAWPHLLPGGEAVLFSKGGTAEQQTLQLLDLRSGRVTDLATKGSNPRYLPTGHIVFGHVEDGQGSLMAVALDLERGSVIGDPVPVLNSVTVFPGGATQVGVSGNGTLLYGAGGVGGLREMVWVDMNGDETPVGAPSGPILVPRVSSDGRRIAYQMNSQIWIFDLQTGSNQQLTFEGSNEDPLWSRNGQFVYFTSQRSGTLDDDGFRQSIDGLSPPAQLFARPRQNEPVAIDPDERWLVIRDGVQGGSHDLMLLDLQSDRTQFRDYLRNPWSELQGTVSPDGRWLAYASNEAGVGAIYVQGFPDPVGKWRVSEGEGADPVWSPDGKALFYWGSDALVRADVELGSTFRIRGRQPLFARGPYLIGGDNTAYDLHPDGKRFLMVKGTASRDIAGVWIVTNWFEELKAKIGESGTGPD